MSGRGFGATGVNRVIVEQSKTGDGPINVELDDVVERLNDICRTATLDLAFRVGECVIVCLFGGDPRLWGSDGARRMSYRALAARGDLALSPSALCRAVGIYVLVEQLGGPTRFRHLTVSHFQEVLPLDGASQRLLLDAAEVNRWSVARLRSEARSCNDKPQRSRHHAKLRTMERIGGALNKHRCELARAGHCGPSPTEAREMLATMQGIRDELDQLEALLSRSARECVPGQSDIVELLSSVRPQAK